MKNLKQQLYKMLIIGFEGDDIVQNDTLITQIKNGLGGVILFDHYIDDINKSKNIISVQQLKTLNDTLQNMSSHPLMICIDQEGGNVARLKKQKGFQESPSAKQITTLKDDEAQKAYGQLASQLQSLNINCNFAPLVDLGINKDSKIIYGLERDYSDDVDTVVKYSEMFIDALEKHKIVSVLKHFPGHGSSKDDSHKGFVDITKTWNEIELAPYKHLLHKTNMIMTAHVFNANLDNKYPSTLSYATNTKLLREKLNYNGVLVTDDLQMFAIQKHYSKEKAIELAINSGVDMLMYCNQLGNDNTDETIEIMENLVLSGKIPIERIQEANQRIDNLLKRFTI